MLSKTTKNRFSYKLDKLFWWIIALAPFVGYFLIMAFSDYRTSNGSFLSLPDFFASYILAGASFGDNVLWVAFASIFGPSGVFPVFSSQTSLYIFNWFIWVELFHLFFDVIVFIPRLAHKWISKAVQDD